MLQHAATPQGLKCPNTQQLHRVLKEFVEVSAYGTRATRHMVLKHKRRRRQQPPKALLVCKGETEREGEENREDSGLEFGNCHKKSVAEGDLGIVMCVGADVCIVSTAAEGAIR